MFRYTHRASRQESGLKHPHFLMKRPFFAILSGVILHIFATFSEVNLHIFAFFQPAEESPSPPGMTPPFRSRRSKKRLSVKPHQSSVRQELMDEAPSRAPNVPHGAGRHLAVPSFYFQTDRMSNIRPLKCGQRNLYQSEFFCVPTGILLCTDRNSNDFPTGCRSRGMAWSGRRSS